MFYEESEITNVLKCEHCIKPYGEYYPPRILPCCGKTICYSCVESIEKQVKNNRFKCIACKKEKKMPNNGFLVNSVAVKLLATQPKEISRGQEAEKLKKNLYDLEQLVNKLLFEMDKGEYIIRDDCRELRRQVQLAKEERIEEINKYCDALFVKIDHYEEKCKSKSKEMNEAKKKANELIKSVNNFIQKQNEHLRQLKFDDNELMASNLRMNELKMQIEKERKNIKKSIFGNQIMKFETNSNKAGEEFLGKLTYHILDFTVIIQNAFISILK